MKNFNPLSGSASCQVNFSAQLSLVYCLLLRLGDKYNLVLRVSVSQNYLDRGEKACWIYWWINRLKDGSVVCIATNLAAATVARFSRYWCNKVGRSALWKKKKRQREKDEGKDHQIRLLWRNWGRKLAQRNGMAIRGSGLTKANAVIVLEKQFNQILLRWPFAKYVAGSW